MKYHYEIVWTTEIDYGTLPIYIVATTKKEAVNKALRYLPADCININVSRVY